MYYLLSLLCFFSLLLQEVYADELFDGELEARYLSHIRQLTFQHRGFEKAGEAYFSPDGKSIIFQAVPKGEKEFQIFTMDLESEIPLMVSTGQGACTCGYFRPDGKKIIFASSHGAPLEVDQKENPSRDKYVWHLTPYMNIYEANLDGSELKPLTSGPAYHAECAYSTDGKEIVYASNEDGSMNLYLMRADGSDVRQMTKTTNCYNGGPFFSPDNQQIIFRADRNRADYLQLFLINSDGTEERQVTFNDFVNWAPFWHPAGEVIAYTTSVHGHKHYELYLLNVVTQATCRLTHNASFDGLPAFSSDGTRMLWTSKRGDGTSQVFIADFQMPEEVR